VLPGQRCTDLNTEKGDEQQLSALAISMSCTEAIALAQDFAQIVRNRQPEHLIPGFCYQSHLPAFVRFAKGLYEDTTRSKRVYSAGVTDRSKINR